MAIDAAARTTSTGTAIAIRGLDHLVLRIADLGAALHFYCDVLGCRIERRIDALELIQLRAGSQLIDLVTVTGPLGRAGGPAPVPSQGGNLDHFALQLEHFDFAAIRTHLVGHGIEVGEPADRYGSLGTGPSLYIRDPDGNTVELKGPAHTPPLLPPQTSEGDERG